MRITLSLWDALSLAGAGLLFRSLIGLQSVDPGLDPSGVLTFRVSLPTARYPEAAKRLQFFNRALEEIRALPGVRSASAANYLPFRGMASGTYVDIGGRPKAKPGEGLPANAGASVKVDHVLADGDLVAVHYLTKIKPEDRGFMAVDIFRRAGCKSAKRS